MEENKPMSNLPGHPEGCKCYGCNYNGSWGMHSYGHRFSLLRILLGLIIIAIAFGVGVKVGEFKGSYLNGDRGFFNQNMMYKHHGGMPYGGMRVYPMMNYSTGAAMMPSTTPQSGAVKK